MSSARKSNASNTWTFWPEVYDPAELKRRYGSPLSFWGALSTQRDLPVMSQDQVRELVRHTVQTLGAGGGYIVGPTHRVPADVPDDAIIAMISCRRGVSIRSGMDTRPRSS